MKVGIIGAGNVGTALATSITKAGHEVSIASRDPEDAAVAAAASGAQVAATNADAARDADVVILAVYAASVPGIADEIGDAIDGKVVVDVTNRMSFGPNGPEIDTTSSNAEAIAEAFPTARVVKAFNTLLAGHQVDPVAEGIRLDGFVAGDDAAAKSAVIELVLGMGLDPIDVGPLVRARQLEALAFLNIALNVQNGGPWQSAWKLVGAPRAVAPAA